MLTRDKNVGAQSQATTTKLGGGVNVTDHIVFSVY